MKYCLVLLFVALCGVFETRLVSGKLALPNERSQSSLGGSSPIAAGSRQLFHLLRKRCLTKRCFDNSKEMVSKNPRSINQDYLEQDSQRPPCLKGRCKVGRDTPDEHRLAQRIFESLDSNLPRMPRALMRPPCLKGRCKDHVVRDSALE